MWAGYTERRIKYGLSIIAISIDGFLIRILHFLCKNKFYKNEKGG